MQASLWLVPLVALVGLRWRDHLIWASAEALHFGGVWLYLAGTSTPDRGLPSGWYALTLVVRGTPRLPEAMRELIAERGLADHACLLRPGQSELFAAARVLRAGFDDGLAEAGAGDDDLATDAAEASAAGAEHGRAADTSWADLPVGPGSGPVAGASPAAPGPS